MTTRPKINIQLSQNEKIIEGLCVILILGLWIGIAACFSILPDQIPSHFNAAGKADDFSTKESIFVLPVVTTLIYAAMTILNNRPHIYNYLTTVTEENARQLYTNATRFIRILKLAVISVLSAIVFITLQTALSGGDGPGAGFLPAVIGLLTVPLIFYFIRANRSK